MKLTDPTVKAIKATDQRQEIPDDLLPGLYLTVQPKTGKKSWQVRYRAAGTHRRMTLGKYPDMALADARTRARKVFRDTQEGEDPAAEVRRAKKNAPTDTVALVLDDYARRHLEALKSGDHAKTMLDRFVRKEWGDLRITDITRAHVRDLIDDAAKIGTGSTANLLLRYLKAFLNWCMDRDLIGANPADRIRNPAKLVRRKRYLNDHEVRWFWKACDLEGYPFGILSQMLLVTGCRLNEVAKVGYRDLTDGLGSNHFAMKLSAGATKNKREHTVPLPNAFTDVLRNCEEMKAMRMAGSEYLFTTTGHGHVKGMKKPMDRIASYMKEIATEESGEPVDIPHWTYHDLRRTCFTGVTRLGYSRDIAHAVVNHANSILAETYDQYKRNREKGEALTDWHSHIIKVSTCSLCDVRTQADDMQVSEEIAELWADQLITA